MFLTENNYILNKNRYFLNWFHDQILAGYDIYLDVSDFQNFIDYVTFWYESKYPNGNDNFNLYNLDDLSRYFTFEQLMYRINHDVYDFINCDYRGENKKESPFYDENGKITYMFEEIFINISSKDTDNYPDFVVVCDSLTGIVKNADQLIKLGIVDFDNINVDNLLYILNTNYKDIYDFDELRRVVLNHKVDLKLRKILIILIGKKILSNDDVSIDLKMKRYNSFIDDFNNHMYDLKLRKEDISGDLKVLLKH